MKLVVALILFGTLVVANGRAAEPMSKPLVAMSGADSHVRKSSYQRVTTPEDWTRIWASHLGTTTDDAYRPLLEVDFDRCLAVVIFRGEEINVRGIQIDSASETADSVVIRFTELGYQTAGESNNKPPDRPYAFVIVPKSDKTVVLEQNSPTTKEPRSPKWIEVARLTEASQP
jgi:hypothetical protein